MGLFAALLGVFLADACPGTDWEMIQTKHYWFPATSYYGGYAAQFVATPRGYRAINTEGLCNYTNLAALSETLPASRAAHPIQGFPGTERVATSFLLSLLMHVPGAAADPWRVFWACNVLLWLASVLLAHRIASMAFGDRYSPLFAAILMATYPALTLTFSAVKQQPLGTTFLLAGIYLFERLLPRSGLAARTAVLASALFMGQFADGGWFFLTVYVLLRSLWMTGAGMGRSLLGLLCAFAVSRACFGVLVHLYHLPSVASALGISFGGILRESAAWVRTWLSGGDVGSLWFLNYPGYDFFTGFWVLVSRCFVMLHAPLMVLAVAGLFLEPRTRMFTFLAVPMFAVGQSGMVLAGWIHNYGYLAFPAAAMLILAAAGVLGGLCARARLLPSVIAVGATALACVFFSGEKRQAGLYYGGDPEAFTRRVEVHYSDDPKPVDY